ncbi:hypothetical protein HanXRQr2_Chr07g0314741 [Helianthus annuus]|uniref:Uncharacterized protein n=1 Tax=Helianthus annuus TaxID=4232 RepID=A0A9K3IPV2_HELAN|nr:hypothetical protein HanXRQr2_Chr07g0314741 [Helianthus annuus]
MMIQELLQVALKMHSHCEGYGKDVKDCIMEEHSCQKCKRCAPRRSEESL